MGNVGWSYDEVLPYFRLSEHNERFNDEFHGQHGPLWVSDLRTDNPVHARYKKATEQAGFKWNDDFNGADQEGIGLYQVTQKDGQRCSAAFAYVLPVVDQRPNLTVEIKAQALKIQFEGKCAVAVEILQNGKKRVIRANKEVILAAGCFQTPQLLMLSGVGPAAELTKHGIAMVQDLPGVGQNLHDHPDFIFGYKTKSLDAIGVSLRGSLKMLKEILRYRKERRGAITSNFAEGGGFLKISPDSTKPDVQLHFVVALVDDHARKFHAGHGFSCHVCLLRPKSRGSVTLASANPLDAPLIDPAFLQDPDDVEKLMAGYKLTKKLMDAPALAELFTKDMFTADVKTDDDIRQVLRQRSDTVYHPVGTCKMGLDDLAVVDPELRVHGLQGLRVVDASVIPTIIGGNTNAPTMMIAEKAYDLITGRSRVSA
jgi:choline dehydrogenase-like flavoprotein